MRIREKAFAQISLIVSLMYTFQNMTLSVAFVRNKAELLKLSPEREKLNLENYLFKAFNMQASVYKTASSNFLL